MPTFTEWVTHWGEPRLIEVIESSQRCYGRMWEESKNTDAIWQYPAWELCLGQYWEESLSEWHSRWQGCGGQLHEGRMIAVKWDTIWAKLSSTFYDGLGQPYPPYARSSCAHWTSIDQDEAIVTGAISESVFNDYVAQFPREPLLGKDGNPISKELLQSLLNELTESIHRRGGPPPGATRSERVAHERKQREETFARIHAEYEQRSLEDNREYEAKNSVFRLLEQVEASIRDAPVVKDARRWEWLCASVNTLTSTAYFDEYPNWRARAWICSAELHRLNGDFSNELSCLEQALSINERLPIKRRIKKLRSDQERPAE